MAATQRFTEDVIIGLKRTLARQTDGSDSEDPIEHPTNRGNKLKRKARYVQRGRLNNDFESPRFAKIWHSEKDGWTWSESGPNPFSKDVVTHTGHRRAMIYRNPPRYDEYGDIIDQEDEDAQGDEEPNLENMYDAVKLEELLRPLANAAELSTHPTMSLPYYSKHLTHMIEQTRSTLQKEQETLWRMKSVFIQFRGDNPWFPAGSMETEFDNWFLKYQDVATQLDRSWTAEPTTAENTSVDGNQLSIADTNTEADIVRARDASMGDTISVRGFAPYPAPLDESATMEQAKAIESQTNGTAGPANGVDVYDHENNLANGVSNTLADGPPASPLADTASLPSHRMTTRARSHNNTQNATPSSPPHSPMSAASTTPPPVHPLFQLPQPSSYLPAANLGLAEAEFAETREFLSYFMLRQEEIVSGVETMYHGLLEAEKMRQMVLRWTRAEGHTGEMSDGEDWVDAELWGLDPEAEAGGLVKGREEEEDGEAAGKRRRGRGAERG